jgi:hypothetical protein
MRNRSRGCDTQNLARATLCVRTHNILQVLETRFSNTATILAHLCSEIHFVTPYLGRHALTRNYARPGLPPGRARNRPKTSVSIAEVYHLAGPLAEVRQENRSGNRVLYYLGPPRGFFTIEVRQQDPVLLRSARRILYY